MAVVIKEDSAENVATIHQVVVTSGPKSDFRMVIWTMLCKLPKRLLGIAD